MTHTTINLQVRLKSICCVMTIVLLQFSVDVASAQKITARDNYIRKGTRQVVIGAVLVVGGAIGINHPSADTELAGLFNGGVVMGQIFWPSVIVTGSVVSAVGIVNIARGRKIQPVIAKQYIPGLDHMGIVYPKYPTIGVKFRL